MQRESTIPTFTSICRNCGAELGGPFCSRCGQEHRHERLRFSYWVKDTIDALATFDSRIWRTIAALTIRPGHMAREYVDGGRAPFVSPHRYAIATCALWWLLAAVANDATDARTGWLIEYGQLVNLVSLPFVALTYQLPFLGSRYNYAETLAFTLYTAGHAFLWRGGLAVAATLGAPATPLLYGDSVLFLVYTAWALWQFHAGRARWRALRIFGALLGASILGAALNVALSILAPAA
jgi:hypothetical protein